MIQFIIINKNQGGTMEERKRPTLDELKSIESSSSFQILLSIYKKIEEDGPGEPQSREITRLGKEIAKDYLSVIPSIVWIDVIEHAYSLK